MKDKYDHPKLVILSQARPDLFNLRLLDFESITESNTFIHRIILQLNLYGEDITEYAQLEKK